MTRKRNNELGGFQPGSLICFSVFILGGVPYSPCKFETKGVLKGNLNEMGSNYSNGCSLCCMFSSVVIYRFAKLIIFTTSTFSIL